MEGKEKREREKRGFIFFCGAPFRPWSRHHQKKEKTEKEKKKKSPTATSTQTAHKHTALALRPGKLVSTGLFSSSRNPNYFGELLTYICLAGLPACALRSPLPLLPLAVSLAVEWVPNMKSKDASLKRHGAEWEEWASRAAFLFPRWGLGLGGGIAPSLFEPERGSALGSGAALAREGGLASDESAEVEEVVESKEKKKDSESSRVLTLDGASQKKLGRSASKTRKRGVGAGGR